MAPETMLRGFYSVASDIYSFGILAWELLHEKDAFKDFTEFSLINSIVHEGHKLKFDSSVPPEILGVLEGCFEVEASQRPSALKICQTLSTFLKSKK